MVIFRPIIFTILYLCIVNKTFLLRNALQCLTLCLKLKFTFTDPTVERSVLTLTIRDSPDCFINISCWGGEQHVTCLASQFHIGDVGKIIYALGYLDELFSVL